MKDARRLGEKLFARRFHQIERTVQAVAARHRLSAEDRKDLHGQVMLKVVQEDFAVLRRFQRKSRWSTYLRVIIQRVLFDHRVKEWGRWRPCALARRLGPTAVRFDRRINRDGLEATEAIRGLLICGVDETEAELERLAERIPRRPQRRILSGDTHLEVLTCREEADRRIEAAERQRAVVCLNRALASILRDLSAHERNLLGMRFGRGWTVRRIAASQDLKERPLYRQFECLLRRLRRRLEGNGFCWQDVVVAFDGEGVDLEFDLP